jgi:thiol-disulfide isomerase/thioredoxin
MSYNRTSFLAALCVALAAFHVVLVADDTTTTLVWANGDRLPGELITVDEREVTWRSSVFSDPLRIRLNAIASIELSDLASGLPSTDMFRIETTGGDILLGNLVAATDSHFEFESATHGAFDVKRQAVRSIQRMRHEGLIYLGPRGLAEWQSQNNQNPLIHWKESPTGQIMTSRRGAGLFLPVPLPMKCEIEFKVRSSGRCSFALGLRNAFRGLRLETWDDSLVAARSLEFQELKTLRDDERALHMTLFVDLERGSLTACSETGVRLSEFRFSDEAQQSTGISFSNRDGDITMEYLRISQWDGTPPPEVAASVDRVHLNDGTTVVGSLQPFNSDTEQIAIGANGSTVNIELADIGRIFQFRSEDSLEPQQVTVTTRDGEFISGESVHVRDSNLQIRGTWSDLPLKLNMANVREIRWQTISDDKADGDVLTVGNKHLHGEVVIAGDTADPLQWRPGGGLNPVVLSGGGHAVFKRSQVNMIPVDIGTYPHVVHLVNGDSLPCRIDRADEHEFQIVSPLFDRDILPVETVIAVEFAAGELRRQTRFAGGDWFLQNATLDDTTSIVTLQPNGVIHNDQLMQGDHVTFHVDWKHNSLCVLGVYCTRNTWQGVQPDFFLVLREGNVAVCGDLQSVPVATILRRRRLNGAANGAPLTIDIENSNLNARFDVQLTGHKLVVRVNGVAACEKLIGSEHPALSGFGIKDLGIGVALRPKVADGIVSPNAPAAVTLSEFEITASTASTAKWVHSEETRRIVVTIPRFRRDRPHTHVLLAPNGDLLRGRLLGLSGDDIKFESRLESLTFHRERVLAIICLSSLDQETDNATTDDGEVQVRLGNGYSITMVPVSATDGLLQGTSSLLGACKVGSDQIAELAVGTETHAGMQSVFQEWVPLSAREPDWGSGTAEEMAAEIAQLIDTPAADFALPALDGSTFRLSDHSDQVVVLDFWATWCGPCVRALPEYAAVTAEFDPAHVVFAAINLQEDSPLVRRFLSEHQLDVLVPLDRDGSVSARFKVTGIPHTVIIAPGGTIADVHVGYQPDAAQQIHATIEKLLDEFQPVQQE